jgi:hypothetical protein
MSAEPIQLRRGRGRPRKIPPTEYPAIMARLAAGETLRHVAENYDVSHFSIWLIKRRVEQGDPQTAAA